MAEPTPPPPVEGPDRGQLPVVTMVGGVLSFFVFVLLCWVMWFFVNQRYKPYDENVDRTAQRLELEKADRAILSSSPAKVNDRFYRVPIDKAMQFVVDESKGKPKEPPK